jgi:elongation factor G
MAKSDTGDMRNIAFVGHGTSGKTTLVETMLYKAGATKKIGRIQDKNTILDTDSDERERGYSIYTAIAHCNWKKRELHIFDCPGYPDFVGEAIGALAAVEFVVVCLDSEDGIKVNTRKMFEQARKRNLPIAFCINRLDKDNARFDEHIKVMKETFGPAVTAIIVPNAPGKNVSSVTNLLNLPADAPDKLKDAYNELKETVISADDALMERYLGGEEISREELFAAFTKAIVKGALMPVMATCAEKEVGVTELLDFLADYGPDATTPLGRVLRKQQTDGQGEPVDVKFTADGPFRAQVVKIISDEFVGKMTFMRVFSGKLKMNTSFYNVRTQKVERIGNIMVPQGGDKQLTANTEEACAGEIVFVAKVEDTMVGDTLTDGENVVFPLIEFPVPWVALAVEPKSRADEQRISGTLQKLAMSDPTFKLKREQQTGEMVIYGMTDLHLQVMMGRLSRMKVEVTSKPPKVPYKETITKEATESYRHKKQTGGRGQFAEVHITISPLERGKMYEFEDAIVGGVITKSFIAAVDKGVQETMAGGVLAGFPVEDVKVKLFYGKTHEVDSSETAFKIAARGAFKAAMLNSKPVLLEPIMILEASVPNQFVGDILGHLNSRRGRVLNTESVGQNQVITASVPLAEIMNYSTELRSMTGGEGSYTMQFARYDVLPAFLMDDVIAKYSKKKTAAAEETE